MSEADFESTLRQQLIEHIQSSLVRLKPQLDEQFQQVVVKAIHDSPEYQSLLGGDLQALFGIADPQPVVNAIVDAVAGSLRLTIKPPSGDSLGGLLLEILREDMSDVLELDEASYVSYSLRRGTETLVPWLQWLLLAGDTIIIVDWEVIRGRGSYTSTRTGLAVMVQPIRRPSHGFQIPAPYSGVVDNNWLTRCLEAASGPIADVLQRALETI